MEGFRTRVLILREASNASNGSRCRGPLRSCGLKTEAFERCTLGCCLRCNAVRSHERRAVSSQAFVEIVPPAGESRSFGRAHSSRCRCSSFLTEYSRLRLNLLVPSFERKVDAINVAETYEIRCKVLLSIQNVSMSCKSRYESFHSWEKRKNNRSASPNLATTFHAIVYRPTPPKQLVYLRDTTLMQDHTLSLIVIPTAYSVATRALLCPSQRMSCLPSHIQRPCHRPERQRAQDCRRFQGASGLWSAGPAS